MNKDNNTEKAGYFMTSQQSGFIRIWMINGREDYKIIWGGH